MKGKISKILLPLLAFVTVALLAVGTVGGARRAAQAKCTGVVVTVVDSASNRFLRGADIEKVIARDFGGCVNRPCGEIDLRRIEDILGRQALLRSSEAYFTADHKLHIDVKQRTPVMKISSQGTIYYLDTEGRPCRVKSDWCKGLPRLKGEALTDNPEWLKDLAETAMWVESSRRWADRVMEWTVDSRGRIGIRLVDRDETFHAGMPVGMEEKFARISKYEKDIFPTLEEGVTYRSVNVEYAGQIICKK